MVEYCNISYSIAQGGADWIVSITDGNTDGGNNTGWNFDATGRPVMIDLGNSGVLRHGGARWIEI